MNRCYIPFKDARSLLQEGDILLFRGQGWVSFFIKKASSGDYSHAALCSWNYNEQGKKLNLEAIEYREFIGSRAISLRNYVEENSGIIDVYRPYGVHYEMVFDCGCFSVKTKLQKFDGKKITDEFRELTGLRYGWKSIWAMAKRHLIIFRWFSSKKYYDDKLNERPKYAVCSNIIAYLYHKHFTDLNKSLANDYVEPSNLAQSPLVSYLFTLTK